MSKEALKRSLEAITTYLSESPNPSEEAVEGLCDARALLAKALKDQVDDTNVVDLIAPVQQEPVATKLETQQFNCFHVSAEDFSKLAALPVGTKLYTSPPASKPWVGLTDDQIINVAKSIDIEFKDEGLAEQVDDILTFARAIEAAHQIGVEK